MNCNRHGRIAGSDVFRPHPLRFVRPISQPVARDWSGVCRNARLQADATTPSLRMNAIVMTRRLDRDAFATAALKAAARFWFVITLIGQWLFAFAVASFYGLTAWRGDYHRWGKFISHGHVAGDTTGNFFVEMHLVAAVAIMSLGALQLVPQVRSRYPKFHRWSGRIYLLAAVAVSAAGLYMQWIRGSIGDLSQDIGSALNAVLIWSFAALALRSALARDFRTHRRWALRLFVVVSAAWFYRIAFFLIMLVFQRPVGFDPATFTGPLPTVMSFAQYLFPLAVLQIYLDAHERGSAYGRIAAAGLVGTLTLAMCAGLFALTLAVWVPDVKAGFDRRSSIVETIRPTLASRGIDAAAREYRQLKAAGTGHYDFDESELDGFGYELIHRRQFKDAIGILQLNAEAWPRSSNVYDSLGDAYAGDGDKPQAIAAYRQALRIDPHNGDAAASLRKLAP